MNTQYAEIQLGGKYGGTTIVSIEDYDKLSKYKWQKNKVGYVSGYINDTKKRERMHHFIMNAAYGQHVDHINGITTDNRRCNLRFLAPHEHAQNRHISKIGKSSKYRGVSTTKSNRFQSSITLEGTTHYLGVYDTEAEAAYQWDHFVTSLKLSHIQLNFPEKHNEYSNKKFILNVDKRKYYGIHKQRDKYASVVLIGKTKIQIGTFNSENEAAVEFDNYVVANNIKGKKLNFPEKYPEYGKEKIIITECEEIDATTVKLLLKYKDEKFVIIDKEDYDKVKYYRCYIGDKGYPFIILDKDIRLYRYLLGVTDSNIFVDHIDSDVYNNKKNNLRSSNYYLNSQNKSKQENTSSKYFGVSRKSESGKWIACISNNNKSVLHATYDDEEMCARARDLYIIENLKNTHYKLNFEWSDDDKIVWKEKINKYKRKYTSSYSGVCFNSQSNNWKASVTLNKKKLFYKQYKTEEYAARARDLYILLNFKVITQKFKLNFEWSTDEISEWKGKLRFQ